MSDEMGEIGELGQTGNGHDRVITSHDARADSTSHTQTFSIQSQLAQMQDEQMRQFATQRFYELDSVIQSMADYRVRDDSRLAFRWITGQLPHMSCYDVAHECACIQYLCNYSSYQTDIQVYLRCLAKQMHEQTGASWTSVWKACAELGSEMFKTDLLLRNGIVFPDFHSTMYVNHHTAWTNDETNNAFPPADGVDGAAVLTQEDYS